jgi:hypothetical protein
VFVPIKPCSALPVNGDHIDFELSRSRQAHELPPSAVIQKPSVVAAKRNRVLKMLHNPARAADARNSLHFCPVSAPNFSIRKCRCKPTRKYDADCAGQYQSQNVGIFNPSLLDHAPGFPPSVVL